MSTDHAARIDAAHKAYKAAIGTDQEQAAYVELQRVVRETKRRAA